MIKQSIIRIIYTFFLLIIFFSIVHADETQDDSNNEYNEQVFTSFSLDDYIDELNKYATESEVTSLVDVNEIKTKLLKGESIDYGSIFEKLLGIFFEEVFVAIKSGITIYIVIILMCILKALQLDKDSSVIKVSYFACFLLIATICIKTFITSTIDLQKTVSALTNIMQILSPFLMTILIATGGISTVGIIQPMLLFLSSFIGLLVKVVIIPLLTISVAFNVINSITDRMNFIRLSNLFSKTSVWIIGIMLTIFLSILSMETSITTSIDSLAVKTTQTAVSNFVPVVGSFFSDSFETVIGATKIVGKTAGYIGIILIILIALIPVIKIGAVMFVFMLISFLSELIGADEKIIKAMDMFAVVYKTMLGVLIGIIILFVISTGIVINISSHIIN